FALLECLSSFFGLGLGCTPLVLCIPFCECGFDAFANLVLRELLNVVIEVRQGFWRCRRFRCGLGALALRLRALLGTEPQRLDHFEDLACGLPAASHLGSLEPFLHPGLELSIVIPIVVVLVIRGGVRVGPFTRRASVGVRLVCLGLVVLRRRSSRFRLRFERAQYACVFRLQLGCFRLGLWLSIRGRRRVSVGSHNSLSVVAQRRQLLI